MKSIKYLGLLLALVCVGLVSCTPDTIEENKETKVYGTVFDSETGDAVNRVQVFLGSYAGINYDDEIDEDYIDANIVSSTFSGSDGYYEFVLQDVSKDLKYELYITSDGYREFELPISLSPGKSYKYDLGLTPLNPK